MSAPRDDADLWAQLRQTQMKVSAWDDSITWLTHLRNGNGKPPLDTRLNVLEDFVRARQKLEWLVIGTLIVAVIGVAVSLGQYIAISGIKSTLQDQVHPAKQLPHSGGG